MFESESGQMMHKVAVQIRKRREDNASQKTCEESPARQRLWIRICHKVFLSLTMDTIFAGDYGSLQALHGSHSRSKHRWGRSELSSYLVKSGVTGFNSGFSSGVFWYVHHVRYRNRQLGGQVLRCCRFRCLNMDLFISTRLWRLSSEQTVAYFRSMGNVFDETTKDLEAEVPGAGDGGGIGWEAVQMVDNSRVG
ncbi:hypothetical protein AXG93_3661s1070 [Marchantia polymorpha subsp. ruderalis]|uniref:Uncharacterized protein n=1 Tax=Marchantia polymorpha subsp. ruderalis TaxID=1480154 RepID=A0A176VL87_MARPO|nr:hypothetical protein AXG93_3661s1070 [Marchantia polymorpha subsp. ruderalis]